MQFRQRLHNREPKACAAFPHEINVAGLTGRSQYIFNFLFRDANPGLAIFNLNTFKFKALVVDLNT